MITDEGLGPHQLSDGPYFSWLGVTLASPTLVLKFLKPLVNLKWLYLDRTAIADEGISLLATSNPNLEWLNLHSNNISDEGVVHLLKFTSLVDLDMRCTQITEAGVERLKAGLPGLEDFEYDWGG